MEIDVTAFGLPILRRLIKRERERKRETNPRKEIGYRVFPDVNRIGRPKAVTFIPIS